MGFASFDTPLKEYLVYVCDDVPGCDDTSVGLEPSACPSCGTPREFVEVARSDRALQLYELYA